MNPTRTLDTPPARLELLRERRRALFFLLAAMGSAACTKRQPPQDGFESTSAAASTSTPVLVSDPPSPLLRVGVGTTSSEAAAADRWKAWVDGRRQRQTPFRLQLHVDDSFLVLEQFAAGQLDAVVTTNAEVLVTRSLGAPCALLTPVWAPRAGDGVLIAPSVATWSALDGKTIGVELGTAEHHWLEKQLEHVGVSRTAVTLVNLVPDLAHHAFDTGRGLGWFPAAQRAPADAVVVGHGQARELLERLPHARAVAPLPGAPAFVTGVWCVSPTSLSERPLEWAAVGEAWAQTAVEWAQAGESGHRWVSTRTWEEQRLQDATRALDAFFQREHAYPGSNHAPEEWRYRVVPSPHLTRP